MHRWLLMSDPAFKELDIPMRPAQRREVEKQIRKNIPIGPIPVWHSYVMTGYDLYDLCEKHHYFYSVKNMSFARKNEAIAWICREQLKRPDLCRQAVCWLLYRLYKALLETENRKAAKEQFQYKQLSPSRRSENLQAWEMENSSLLKKIGDEYHLTRQTIRNYVRYGQRLDKLEEMFPGTRIRVLKGEIEMPIIFTEALMQMPKEELAKMVSDPQCKRLVPPEEVMAEIRDVRQSRYKKRIHVETAIKETPAYDPDAELNGLTYTITAWIRALSRTETAADLRHATGSGKERLRSALIRLKAETECLYKMLEVNEHERSSQPVAEATELHPGSAF